MRAMNEAMGLQLYRLFSILSFPVSLGLVVIFEWSVGVCMTCGALK